MFAVCKECFLKAVFRGKYLQRNLATKSKKLSVVKIWHGITLREIREAVNLSESQVNEALFKARIKRIESIEDAKILLKLLQRRYDIVSAPESKVQDEGVNIISTIGASRLQLGTNLLRKPSVVTIMGHVDHGKTTLLDALRHSEIVKTEFGGITQHIGAFVVSLGNERVTILDTPGHAAFAAMRRRGVIVTDIVVLVVAADDGVMPQTIESISYAKEANVPIIVAISKVDKVKDINESLKLVKSGLFAQGIILEEDGGDTQAIKISALKGEGLIELKEAVLALSEMMQLKSAYDGGVEGTIIESSIHAHRGRLATILVRSGTLKKGDVIIAGQENIAFAKVRAMFDEWGKVLEKVTPGLPVQIVGWRNNVLPASGDTVIQVKSEHDAQKIFTTASNVHMQRKAESDHVAYTLRAQSEREVYKAELEAKRAAGIKKRMSTGLRQKEIKDDPSDDKKLNLILKTDVNGTLEALLDVLESYPNELEDVKLNIIHSGVGSVTENDVEFASCFKNTYVYGFNVSTLPNAFKLAKELSVPIFTFNVIYKLIDSVKSEISRRLPQNDVEEIIGEAVVLQEFLINEKNKKVKVAGCRCVNGFLKKDCFFKLKRGGNIIKDKMELASMRHLKDEVSVIKKDMECGLKFGMSTEDDIHFQHTDSLVCYQMKKVKQISKWNPEGF